MCSLRVWQTFAMKTTIEIPDDVLEKSKAMAAVRGESFAAYVTALLRAGLEERAAEPEVSWKKIFGKASPEEISEVDEIIEREFERIDLDTWR